MNIHYSCLKCNKKFLRIDDMENHLEEKHKVFDQKELNRSYLINFFALEEPEVN